jgi:hypothetical protein
MRGSELCFSSTLSRDEWQARKAAHVARVAAWADDRVSRVSRRVANPVFDFLFDYYPFRPAHLKRWSPGIGVFLQACTADDLDWKDNFAQADGGCVLSANSFPEHRHPFLLWALKYLTNIAERPPQFSCFGLHEWAMVYKCDTPRHSTVPLRLSKDEISKVVETLDLRCTHFDAFRFFTPEAVPLNRNQLTREVTTDFDQRACIHVTMDLYKFAHKVAPWCSSELIADAFLLAAEARKVDMRASPYDLAESGFAPILIETLSGREEYIQEQRRIAELATPVRSAIIEVYKQLVAAIPV